MSNYDSVEYAARKGIGTQSGTTITSFADGRDFDSKAKLFPFHWVVPTTPGTGPTVNLCKVPKGFKPRLVVYQSEALSASANVGLNVRIGDAGDGTNTADDDRLMADVDSDAAASSVGLAVAAADFEYLADTIIVATLTTGKTPVAGTKIYGFIMGTRDG